MSSSNPSSTPSSSNSNSNDYIVGLGGTLRANSLTRVATQYAVDAAIELGGQGELLDLRTLNLPMYNPDLALTDYSSQDQVNISKMLDACRKATAMVWCSPCYHGTVSGVFKNALDMLELMGNDAQPYLTKRLVGLIVVNDSKTFSAMSNSVHELRAWLAPTHVTLTKIDFDEGMNLVSENGTRRVRRLVQELLSFND